MKTSESIDKLAAALVLAQAAIQPAIKDANNPAFRSKYADLSAVWAAVRDVLADNSLAVTQLPVHAEDERVHLTTRLVHASGQWIEETASIPVSKRDAHGFGSGYTYLRRYALSALLGVVADDDDDGNAAATKTNGAERPNTARQVAVDALNDLPPDEQKFLRDEATKIIDLHEQGKTVFDYIEGAHYDNEEKLALWSLLPSQVRSAISRQREEMAAIKKPTPAELATQG